MSRREELSEKRTSMTTANNHAGPLEGVGIEFIEENGGGPGVRLRASKKGEVEGSKIRVFFVKGSSPFRKASTSRRPRCRRAAERLIYGDTVPISLIAKRGQPEPESSFCLAGPLDHSDEIAGAVAVSQSGALSRSLKGNF